jgi:nitronate monooxygenase
VRAGADDVVTTEAAVRVPVAVLNTESVKRLGQKAGPIARWMLSGRKTKHWMRTIYGLRLDLVAQTGPDADAPDKDFWQAGKSVATISSIEPAGAIVRRFAQALEND